MSQIATLVRLPACSKRAISQVVAARACAHVPCIAASMAGCSAAVYEPRRPEKTALYRAVADNLDLFYERYDDRFLEQHGPLSSRAVKTLEGFVRCGRLPFGFSRVQCETCGSEFLVAFSCQLRGVCSSCQQKRAEVLCRFVEDEVVAPVDHRQLVFVLPKMLRSAFHRDRELLRGLCRAAVDSS